MEIRKLRHLVQEFRNGILGRRSSRDACFIICYPLQGYLSAAEGVSTELCEVWYGGAHHHCVLKTSDDVIIDPTIDQFEVQKKPFSVYVGPMPDYFSLARQVPVNEESVAFTRRRVMKQALLQRDGVEVDGKRTFECCWCSRRLTEAQVTIEHVMPKSKGGADALFNLKIACRLCNTERAHWEAAGIVPKYDNEAQKYVVHPQSGLRRGIVSERKPKGAVPGKPIGAKRDKGKWGRMLAEGTARYRKQMGWDKPPGS